MSRGVYAEPITFNAGLIATLATCTTVAVTNFEPTVISPSGISFVTPIAALQIKSPVDGSVVGSIPIY